MSTFFHSPTKDPGQDGGELFSPALNSGVCTVLFLFQMVVYTFPPAQDGVVHFHLSPGWWCSLSSLPGMVVYTFTLPM
jgi:hypothetical protein